MYQSEWIKARNDPWLDKQCARSARKEIEIWTTNLPIFNCAKWNMQCLIQCEFYNTHLANLVIKWQIPWGRNPFVTFCELANWKIYRQSPPIFLLLPRNTFRYLMQIWQLFIILRQPVTISVTIFSNPTKLTNDIFIHLFQL